MRAAWYERKGPAKDVFQVGELSEPRPGPGEVLVRLKASGINPSDTKGRGGARGNGAMPFPVIIPHQDGAGVIEDVGEGVPKSRVGERVWVYEAQLGRAFGTAAEYARSPAAMRSRCPTSSASRRPQPLECLRLLRIAASLRTVPSLGRRCSSRAVRAR